jgi:hypothetical protein
MSRENSTASATLMGGWEVLAQVELEDEFKEAFELGEDTSIREKTKFS